MKSERVTLLTTREFKTFITREAKRENVSVAELVRKRCEGRTGDGDDTELRALTAELRSALGVARKSAKAGLAEMETVLAELSAKRARHSSNTARSKVVA